VAELASIELPAIAAPSAPGPARGHHLSRFALIFGIWTLLAIIRTPSAIFVNGFGAATLRGWEYGFGLMLVTLVPWMLATPLILLIADKLPLERRAWGRRLALHILLAIVIIAIASAAGVLLSRPFTGYSPVDAFGWWWTRETIVSGLYAVTSYVAVLGVGHAARYFERSRRLRLALDRAMGQIDEAGRPSAAASGRYLSRLAVRDRTGRHFVELASVDRIDAADHYLAFRSAGRDHLLRGSLSALEARLDPAEFVRVHRSTILRVASISAVRARGKGDQVIELHDGSRTMLGRSYQDSLRARLALDGL
jgi:hypothetical protein